MTNELILATRNHTAESIPQMLKLLTFQLNDEPFVIDIRSIREILEYGALTEVPLMPGFIRGVLNLRGSVVPVIDLAARFGRVRSAAGQRACIVIIEVPAGRGDLQVLGVVVDAVNEVIEVAVDSIRPAPSFGAGIRTDFISGMVHLSDRFTIVLDVAMVLSIEEIAQLVGVEREQVEDAVIE